MKRCITSYRMILIIPNVSLVFKKLLFRALYSIVKPNVNDRSRSLITQLLLYRDNLYSNLGCLEISYNLRLDFGKAFDKLPHSILVSKLIYLVLVIFFFNYWTLSSLIDMNVLSSKTVTLFGS